MMDPTRVTYPWKMLFWLAVTIAMLAVIVNFCYAQSPTPSLPGGLTNQAYSGSVGGPAMVIPPTGSPTFIYPVAPAPITAPVAPAPITAPVAPVMIIPPTGLPTFVYPGVSR